MDPKRDKVFDKLLMSFHMRKKKLLSFQRNQIFNQEGCFFAGGVGGKSIWIIVHTYEKNLGDASGPELLFKSCTAY